MNNLQVLILSGGIGKRMFPLTVNKSLIPFLGKAIIEHLVDDLMEINPSKIIIVTNKANHNRIEKIAGRKKIIETVIQPQPKGMADAINNAKKKLTNAPLLILNSSDFLNKNVYQQVADNIKGKEIMLGALEVDDYLPGGYFQLEKNKVVGLVEKPGAKSMPSKYFKLVIDFYKNPQLLFDCLQKVSSVKDDLYEVALDKIIKEKKVEVLKIKSYYQILKYPWHILKMMRKFFKHRFQEDISSKAQISDRAVLKGPVVIKKGVKILAGAVIKGPCYIGENTVIGNNVLLRDSMIAKNCVVGYNTEVARSWVGNEVHFHCNYIGDSIIEGKNNFGSGARLANFRFDEKEVFVRRKGEKINTEMNKFGAVVAKEAKLGINSSIMPGVLIEQGVIVSAGELVK